MPTIPILALRSDLRRLVLQFGGMFREAGEILCAATREQWLWSPDRNIWSMALVVEHLNSVARLGLPRIEETLARIRAEGALSDAVPKYGFIERLFISMLSPNPPFRVPVPTLYIPKPAADPVAEIGPEFIKALARTSECLFSANGLDLKRLKMQSPADARIRFPVGVWLEGIVAHNDYHWLQVRALRSHPQFPKS